MDAQKIIKGNRLIAEFIGAKMIVTDYHGINIIEFPNKESKDLLDLKYHSSWDYLMPVIEKIEALDDADTIVTIQEDVCHIWGGEINEVFDRGSKLNSAYAAVVRFIEWYHTK